MGFDGLQFAGRAMTAQSTALDVTGENLARMNTPGYTRQAYYPQLGPSSLPNGTLGQSWQPNAAPYVNDAITRFRNTFLDSAVRTQNGVQGYADSMESLTKQLSGVFDETTAPGLTAAVNTFFSGVQAAAMTPNSLPLRSTVLTNAQSVVSTFNNCAAQLATMSANTYTQIGNTVDSINTTLQQIADLNNAVPTAATTQTNEMIDQRDLLIDNLSKQVNISVQQQPGGDVVVYQGGIPLVFGKSARTLSTGTDATTGAVTIQTDNGKALTPTGGTLGSLLDLRNTNLAAATSSLNTIATTFASTVNNILGNCTDLNGNTGSPLFSGTTAATLAVGISDPKGLAFAASSVTSTAALNVQGVTSAAAINAVGQTVDQTQALSTQVANLAVNPSIASGTIIVNGVSVNWNTTQSLKSILSNIQSAAGSGVTTTFNAGPPQTVTLSSTATSGPAISITDGSGNLSKVLGLASTNTIDPTQSLTSQSTLLVTPPSAANGVISVNGAAVAWSSSQSLDTILANIQAAALSTTSVNAVGQNVDPTQTLSTLTSSAVLATNPNIGSGTIVVNGTTVSWNNGQSINTILANIQSAAGQGVTATFNTVTNTINLTNTSSKPLVITDGVGNLSTVLGLANLRTGVNVSFDGTTQKVTLTRNPTVGTSGPGITVSDVSGNLSSLLGLTGATVSNGIPGDGGGAKALAGLLTAPLATGFTIGQTVQQNSASLATTASYWAQSNTTATTLQNSLVSQQQQTSGVNSDEEAVNMMQYQRAYEAAVRLATAQDDLLTTIINQLGAGH